MNAAFRQLDSQRNVQDDSRRNPLRNLPPHSPAPLRPDPISCPWYGKPSDPGCRGRKGDDRAGLPERARSRIPSLHPPPPRLSQDIDNVAMTNLVGKGDIEVLRRDARRRAARRGPAGGNGGRECGGWRQMGRHCGTGRPKAGFRGPGGGSRGRGCRRARTAFGCRAAHGRVRHRCNAAGVCGKWQTRTRTHQTGA